GGRLATTADAREGVAARLQPRPARGQDGPVRRPRHRGRVAGTGGGAGARDALPPRGDRRAPGGRLSGRDDADGILRGARATDALGPWGGGQVGPFVRGAPLPSGRPAGGGVRRGSVRTGARRLRGPGSGERAQGVPQRRFDGPGGGGAAAGRMAETVGLIFP